MASAGGKMLSAEERRRQRELEEARKAGLAAPEVDEEGKAINPHIPQFMASAPWYLNNEGPTLKHQRNWKGEKVEDETQLWYDRGAKVFQATKYRKGACENCGSMSHKTKDCLERPRSKGARWTGKGIAADDKVQDINISSFDAKRDRWNGYSSEEWVRQAEKFDKIAELRSEMRRKELLEKKFATDDDQEAAIAADLENDEAKEEDDDDEGVDGQGEEDKVEETEDAGFATIKKRVRASGQATGTVRNLRIREDTAKYLLNLDVDSAYYDPKSRSMREDPNPEKDASLKTFAGDNFVRSGGDATGFQHLNLFSVTAYERGQETHLQANPSQAELAYKTFQAKKAALQGQSKSALLETYGSAAATPTEEVLALRGTEAYVEYDASGRVIRGQEVKTKSRYDEDVMNGNHTSVWGSWWRDGQWGYACCHQTVKNAYCTGAAGQEAAEDHVALLQKNVLRKQEENEEEKKKKSGLQGVAPGKKGVWGTDADREDIQLDEEKLKKALRRAEEERRRQREGGDGEEGGGTENNDRKRTYNSLREDWDVSAEDMEAYRMTKSRGDDPMEAIEKLKKKKKAAKGNADDDSYELV